MLLPYLRPYRLDTSHRKCTRIEIHLVTRDGLQLMLDVPIYGRISAVELFRPHGKDRDCLFIATERYKFVVLEWDSKAFELITRSIGDVSDRRRRPSDNGQIGIIDPDCRLIGLHLYYGFFKVFPFDSRGQLKEAFDIRLEELQVLDIKFLYGCQNPTIVVLYQDNQDARHVKTYEVVLKNKKFVKGPWFQNNLDQGAEILIPVPRPCCGVLIIGRKTIAYCSAGVFKSIPNKRPKITAYGRMDPEGYRHLLGDISGWLSLLKITHKEKKVTGLKIQRLGTTSIPSTITFFDEEFVYIGSSVGDSQLIKLNQKRDISKSFVKVLESYVNLGPIVDLCVVDSKGLDQGQVVTCSGALKDGSLCIVQNGMWINEQKSEELEGITGLWSLRSSTDDSDYTLLVASFMSETIIFAMISENDLEEHEIKGFNSDERTLFCHNAIHNQLVQVTSSTVRLVNSTNGELRYEWRNSYGELVTVATANPSQVLLASSGGHLVYLEIGDGILKEAKHVKLSYDISCLNINPAGQNPNYSDLAVVGVWNISVGIYHLPDLNLLRLEHLGGEIIPRSVLLCTFEEISYLLCALGDGHLITFLLNTSTGELADKKKVSLGIKPITLRTISSKNATHVFATSDRSTVIYSINKELLYCNVNLEEVSHMCPFNTAAFPDSLAIAKEGKLIIGTIDDIRKLHIRSFPLGEQALYICHQEQSKTFGVICLKCNQTSTVESEVHFLHVLDDQTFKCVSSLQLDDFEHACSIISCPFSDDNDVYYCVGTAYASPKESEKTTAYVSSKESETTKGRILVFTVRDGKLQRIAVKETEGAVCSLNAFNGKLLAAIDQKIQLYKWMLRGDGARELQYECEHHGNILAFYVQTRGDFIIVGDLMKLVLLLIYRPEEGAIEEIARYYNANWMSAVEILDDDIYLGAENNYNLFTVRRNIEGVTDEEQGQLELVGEYHLGEFVNRFQHGSLIMLSDVGQILTVIFGTVSGMIGVIASLPNEQYVFLEELQSNLRKVIKGVGGLSHEQWRSFNSEEEQGDARNFLDGDLIESFLNLDPCKMDKISMAMSVSVEELCKRVEGLTKLH